MKLRILGIIRKIYFFLVYLLFSPSFSLLRWCVFSVFSFQENAETCQGRSRATEGRVSSCDSSSTIVAAGIGVEGVSGAWSAQRGRQSLPPPLASRRLGSVASASFNPIVAATSTTQRCSSMKGAATVNAATPKPLNIYLGPPFVAEISKEDAMEPETKEEDERRSSTPSPEVASFLPVIGVRFFFMCNSVYKVFPIYFYSYINDFEFIC